MDFDEEVAFQAVQRIYDYAREPGRRPFFWGDAVSLGVTMGSSAPIDLSGIGLRIRDLPVGLAERLRREWEPFRCADLAEGDFAKVHTDGAAQRRSAFAGGR